MESTRRSMTRSRNGCAVCKSKRVKCDEAKPYCSRCRRLGIQCPGYQKDFKWVRGSEGTGRRVTPAPSLCGIVSPTSPHFEPRESIEHVYSEVQDLGFLEQFTDIIQTPGSIDLSETVGQASQLPTLQFPDLSCLPEQVSNYPLDDSHETGRVSTWVDSARADKESRTTAIDRRRKSMQHELLFTRQASSLPKPLQDYSSILVEYYFKEVCGMMSCYDSPMNPYRTTVSGTWSNSASLYYIIQSMAAACLSEVSPALSTIGRQFQDRAICILSNDIGNENQLHTSSLMALVMLGFSMSWHDPSSLGSAEFQLLSKALLAPEPQNDEMSWPDKQKRFFFYNSLVYWKMLLSFATDGDLALPMRDHFQPTPPYSQHQSHVPPHPQTGIGIEVQELVAQVGSLIRKERKRIRSRQCSSRKDIEDAESAIREAERLHVQLCAVKLPEAGSIMDSGDDMTPPEHLVRCAEAYRLTGLLQLYRNFPDLLPVQTGLFNSLGDSQCQSPHFSGSGNDHVQFCMDSQVILNTWLTSLAMHIIDLIHDIPITSKSRSIQPLLLVSICSELSLSRSFCTIQHPLQTPIASIVASPRFLSKPSTLDVLHVRRSLIARLSSFENVLAAKPIRKMMDIVKETWSCMDETQQEAYWMDVMMEKGYETLMG